ncbi:MAG: phosphoethanolamine--lipid A transferase [Methylotenera sp.]|uniref:phosphoethanolamine transferase n=1 Tax=Methylotenera sp. TaxID=2051956 RepID=UPI002487D281|nr:phosphoethanolamine--lipid A transferase [Methylotenera sp.]MDI1308882.1 phosphoethanolamine--lipid A transferase [Methylotenera sp.]
MISFPNISQKLTSSFNQISSQTRGIFLVVAYIMLTGNLALFGRIVENYPFTLSNLPFILSLSLFFTIVTALFFLLICHGKATRWILAIYLLIVSQTAYYMDTFGVVVDVSMLDNIMQTNVQEFAGLLTVSLVVRTVLLGIIPAWLVIKYFPKSVRGFAEILPRLRILGILLLLLIVVMAPFSGGYASFIRQHKATRFYANPIYSTFSIVKYVNQQINIAKVVPLKHIAQDAEIVSSDGKPELMVMVVGETARADRFSLNGYHKPTNPLLTKQGVVSLTNVSSCGTSTGVSVPCMFSSLGRKAYDKETALNQQDALDVLADHGVEILWRDNNSDSKGVATRMKSEDFRTSKLNPVCDVECRDIGMLSGLEQYVEARKDKDILIVFHQMGNHGPEYYKRYPKEFEKFKPVCTTGELKDCTKEEIDNSYDNAILYTDYFLSNVIDFLKKYEDERATAMLYVSDHGESLGEHGIYLHSAPYMVAPVEQTHVPAIVWMGKNFDYKKEQLLPHKDDSFSHDDVFCSVLVSFELYEKICTAKIGMLMQNPTLTNNVPK